MIKETTIYNLISDDKFIQCAAMKLLKEKTFEPRKHFKGKRIEKAYVHQVNLSVIKGFAKCTFMI